MKIYLDVCCLNRPFDDQTQDRVRLESEAVLLILTKIYRKHWTWVSSEVVNDEIEQTPNQKRRERIQALIAHANSSLILDDAEIKRAEELEILGFSGMDALHLACAENNQVDIFFTTDDKLLRHATRLQNHLHILVYNPLTWLIEQKEMEIP